jgi:hypothetical protein
MIRFTLLFLLVSLAPTSARNIAPDGTAIVGVHNTVDTTLGTPYYNTSVNPPTVLNNGNTNATVDTWSHNTINNHSYIGVIWPTTRTDQVNTITVDFATFLDGGWFGPNHQTSGLGNPLDTALHHTEPTVQVTTDGGSVWNNITTISNYPSQMDGHEIGGGGNPNPTRFQATWTLNNPQNNINGIRLIGREGGNAGADSNGFISASEISIDASPAPVNPILWADPVRLQAGKNSILHWDLPDGVSSAVLQTSTGSFLANVTTDTGSLVVQPLGIATYHLDYGSTTALATAFSEKSLLITEFMANNDNSLEDEDGDNEDWIEIYNASTAILNTSAWSLSDDLLPGTEWILPARSLAPGEFLVVFASGKNRSPASGELHTDFKLSADGEDLVLRNPANQITSSFPAFGTQYPDISQGIPMLGVTETPANPAYFNPASPMSENSAGSSPGPVIENVTKKLPFQPANAPLLITAQVSSPTTTLTTVTLHHRRMFAAEQSLVMLDDGTNGDTTANDGIYSAIILGSQFIVGEMVRWHVTAEENTGITSREPRFASPLNSPEYHGTVTSNAAITGQLPVIHRFTVNPASVTSPSGTRSSLYFNGEFYDNVFSRRRGHFGSTLVPKKSIRFDFNPGYHFRILQDEPRVEEINLNTTDPDKSYIRQILSWDLYEMAGVPGSRSFMMRLGQNGSFWGVSTYVEQPDEDFLNREPLLDNEGALYKMFNETINATFGAEKKTRRDENNSDLHALVTGVSPNSPSRNTFLWDNVDIPAAINFMAASRVMHENDDQAKNYYLFRNPNKTGEWTFVPWDKDLTWGRNYTRQGTAFESIYNDTIWADNDTTSLFAGTANASPSHPLFGNSSHTKNDGPWCRLNDAIIDNPVTRRMYLRRLRTQMDELLQTSSTPLGNRVLENRIEELYAHMADQVALDRAIWASPNPPYGAVQTFRQAVDIIKNNYLPRRRNHLYSLVLINPTNNPDHALPQNWRPSVSENGNPGTSSIVTAFTGDPDEDLDLDGLSALVEYALGTTDDTFDPSPLAFINGAISFSRKLAADDIRIIVETSTDLITWKANNTTLTEQVHNNNGTLTEHRTIPSGPRLFIRIQISLIP